MLKKAGRDAGCLECGAHWPMGEAAARALAKAGREPSALNNNCSGKHAGFVCLSCGIDEDPPAM
jgi:L-asparaginase II